MWNTGTMFKFSANLISNSKRGCKNEMGITGNRFRTVDKLL